MHSPGAPRLGLTVVGRLAATHGFQVTLEPGAGGGATTRIHVPGSLLTTVTDGAAAGGTEASPDAAAQPLRRRSPSPASAEPPSVGAGGLPQRRRWSPAAEEPAPAVAGTDSHHPQDPYDQAGLWLGAFRAGEDGQRS